MIHSNIPKSQILWGLKKDFDKKSAYKPVNDSFDRFRICKRIQKKLKQTKKQKEE